VATSVTNRSDEEETLRHRINQLKKREKRLREERHSLEAQLREKIFKRYKKLSERIEEQATD
jgi:chaperonin cofactor prefoldin